MLTVGLAVNAQQTAEKTTVQNKAYSNDNTNSLFDPLFNYQIGMELGNNGKAGVIFIEDEFWVSDWSSDRIFVLDDGGNYVGSFTIPEVSGVRSMTTDGKKVYLGNASNNIFEVDPDVKTLDRTIYCKPSTDALTRMTAYDSSLDNGNGGFYISNFNSDISAIDRNGNELFVIQNKNFGGSGVYGGAVDHFSDVNNTYLWVFEQIDGGRSVIRQLELPSGNPTGVSYNYNTSGLQPSGNSSIAGSMFIVDDWNGSVAIVGVGQGAPYDQLFGIELTGKDHNKVAKNQNSSSQQTLSGIVAKNSDSSSKRMLNQ